MRFDILACACIRPSRVKNKHTRRVSEDNPRFALVKKHFRTFAFLKERLGDIVSFESQLKIIMADVDGNIYKRRKLNPSEELKRSNDESPSLKFDDRNVAGLMEEQPIPENEGDGFSNIDAVEAAKAPLPLSKSQLKKLRRQEQWEAAKELRKDKRRDKRHEKQARKAQEKAQLFEKIAKGEFELSKSSLEESQVRHTRPVQVPVTLIIDCDFDDLMTEKELISMGAQLTRCYSDNRHSKVRAHIAVSSWKGALRTRFETVLTNHHNSWKGVRFMEKDFVEVGHYMDFIMRSQDGGKLVGALAPQKDDKTHRGGRDGIVSEHEAQTSAIKECSTLPGEVSTLEDSMEADPAKQVAQDQVAGSTMKPQIERDETFHGYSTVEPLSNFPESKFHSYDKPSSPKSTFRPSITTMSANAGADHITTAEGSLTSLEPSIIYLTSDSPHTLDRLVPHTSYIIGGIVDKNRHKGLCYKRACERGIPTAKLPIGDFMTMQSRTVLTTNHVVEIMLKWLDTGDWGESFLRVIPKRKEARLRVKKGCEDGSTDAGKDEESVDEDVEGEDSARGGCSGE